MYVCLCNGIRDSELEELGRKGITNAARAYKMLESEFACACCEQEAEEILKAAAKGREPHLTLVAG